MSALKATVFIFLGVCASAGLIPQEPAAQHGNELERRDVVDRSGKPVYLVTETKTFTETIFFNPGIDVVETSKVTSTTYLATSTAAMTTLPCTTNSDANKPPSWAVSTITTYLESVDTYLYTLDHPISSSSALTYTDYDVSWVTAKNPLRVTGTACANTLVWSHVEKATATTAKTLTRVGRYESSKNTQVCMLTILPQEKEKAAGKRAAKTLAGDIFASTTRATTTFDWTKTETATKTRDIPVSTVVTTVCNNPTFSKDVYRTHTSTPFRVTTVYTLGSDCAGKSSGAKPTPRAVVEEQTNLDAIDEKREEECGFKNSAGREACYEAPPTKPGVYTSTFWVVNYHDVVATAEEKVATSLVTVCEMPVFAPTVTESAGP